MVPLSVRISEADAEFLAKRTLSGAKTPSEKLRAILASERQRWEGGHDFAAAAALAEDLLHPALERARAAPSGRSELVHTLYERAPEVFALLMAEAPAADADPRAWTAFEARLADQVIALCEAVVRLALTRTSRTHDPALFAGRLDALFELVDLAGKARQPEKGDPEHG
ncbi:MAG: hypothetical protein ACFB2Z_12175 [Maricaulaceae bacterium]